MGWKGGSRKGSGERIMDRTLVKQGLGKFAHSSKSESGKSVLFTYPSGAKYTVPLEFILKWFKSLPGEGADSQVVREDNLPIVLRTRTISDGHIVRVYLSNARQYDVVWDTVLMACEPLYEHYGGLTEQSRELTRRWHSYGLFRTENSSKA
jgi:hypothetical protein